MFTAFNAIIFEFPLRGPGSFCTRLRTLFVDNSCSGKNLLELCYNYDYYFVDTSKIMFTSYVVRVRCMKDATALPKGIHKRRRKR